MTTHASENDRRSRGPNRRTPLLLAAGLACLLAIAGASGAAPRDIASSSAAALGRAIVSEPLQRPSIRVSPPASPGPSASATAAVATPAAAAPAAETPDSRPTRPAARARSAAAGAPVDGKGMWIWHYGRIAGGNHETIVRHAENLGLTHIYVRVGSGYSGLDTLAQVAPVIPVAHRAGIKVIAWYFPYYNDIQADVRRSVEAMSTQVRGESFDGFAADIEPAKGADFSAETAAAYSRALRAALPDRYLIAVPMRPTKSTIASGIFDAIMPHYDAVAPMTYWGRFDPAETVRYTIEYLSRYGKPVSPVGQTYDMGPEGGPRGNPPPHQTWAFMKAAGAAGAVGVSFWSWQHATSPEFDAIRKYRW